MLFERCEQNVSALAQPTAQICKVPVVATAAHEVRHRRLQHEHATQIGRVLEREQSVHRAAAGADAADANAGEERFREREQVYDHAARIQRGERRNLAAVVAQVHLEAVLDHGLSEPRSDVEQRAAMREAGGRAEWVVKARHGVEQSHLRSRQGAFEHLEIRAVIGHGHRRRAQPQTHQHAQHVVVGRLFHGDPVTGLGVEAHRE